MNYTYSFSKAVEAYLRLLIGTLFEYVERLTSGAPYFLTEFGNSRPLPVYAVATPILGCKAGKLNKNQCCGCYKGRTGSKLEKATSIFEVRKK